MHWLLLAVALGILAITNWQLRELDPWHLRAQFVFRAEDFQAIASSWRKRGQLQTYRRFVAADFATLVCYGAFGYVWVAVAPQFSIFAGWRQSVALLLPFAAVADACENVLHLHFTASAAPTAPRVAYPLAGALSFVKFVAIAVFSLAAIYALTSSAG